MPWNDRNVCDNSIELNIMDEQRDRLCTQLNEKIKRLEHLKKIEK